MQPKRQRKKRPDPMANLSQHLAGRVEKDSRVLQAEIALRRNLRSGSWKHFVPGIRTLATSFGVSPATMVKAVERVRSDGWISSEGVRRRFVIHRDVILKSKSKDRGLRTLLLLSPKVARAEHARGIPQILLHLWETLTPNGWNIRFHLDDYISGKRRQKEWDDLVALEKPQVMMAVLGTPAMAAWARDTKIPMFFCGGSTEDHPVPIAGISNLAMLGEALDRLIALGHQKIIVPLCERKAHVANYQKTVKNKFTAAGYEFNEEFSTPVRSESRVEHFRECLNQSFAIDTPTAIICIDWRECIATLCYAKEHSIRVPEDLSLICLSSDQAAAWLTPSPCRYQHPLDQLTDTLCGWLEDMTTYQNFQLAASLPGIWIDGETTAPPSTTK